MAREESTRITYEIDLMGDCFQLTKVSTTIVWDGRGRRWSDGATEREVVDKLTGLQVAKLIETGADALGYIADKGWEED